MKRSRISILDGFRAISILLVLLFHYFSRWAPPKNPVSLYPYNSDYAYFGYGYLGVQFFFIISGFVIFFTLENTENFSSFWKSRLIRLLPSMLIASLITLCIFLLFDQTNIFPYSHSVKNLIPSLSFISPNLLNNIFGDSRFNFDYINGSYWSLWPEIQFYLLSSLLYFLNKKKFIRNFLLVIILLIGFNQLISIAQMTGNHFIGFTNDFLIGYTKWFKNGFNLITYLPFFSIGVLFYLLFKNNQNKIVTSNSIVTVLSILILFILYQSVTNHERVFLILMIALFFCFVYIPNMLSFLEHESLTKVGESSYFLYLIHENIGILIIYSIGQYFLPVGFILPLLLIIGFVRFSIYYTSNIEKKIGAWLKSTIIGVKNSAHSNIQKMNHSIFPSGIIDQKIALLIPVLNDKINITEAAINEFAQINPTVLLSFIIDAKSKKTIHLLKNIQVKSPDNMVINMHHSIPDQIEAIRLGMLFAYKHTNATNIGFLDPTIDLSLENWLSMAKYQEQNPSLSAIFGSRCIADENLALNNSKPRTEQFTNTLYKVFDKAVMKTNFQDIFYKAKIFNRNLIPFLFEQEFEDAHLFEIELLLRLQQKFGKASIHNGVAFYPISRADENQIESVAFSQVLLLPFKLLNLYFKYLPFSVTLKNKLFSFSDSIQRLFSFNSKKQGLSTKILISIKS